MKRKIVSRLMISNVIILTIIFIVNVFITGGLYLQKKRKGIVNYRAKSADYYDPSEAVRTIGKNLKLEDGKLILLDEDKEFIKNERAWIQILDEDRRQIYSYNLPGHIQKEYSNFELVDSNLNSKPDTLFVQKFDSNRLLLIGFSNSKVRKYTNAYNLNFQNSYILTVLVFIGLLNVFMSILAGVFIKKSFLEPAYSMIGDIEVLKDGGYIKKDTNSMIYGEVFSNLNNLSTKLEMAEKERERLSQLRKEWILNISHDLKTPLSSIKGYSEILASGYDLTKEEVESYAKVILEKSMYIDELIEELNLSIKIKDENSPYHFEKIELVSFMRDTIVFVLNENIKNEVSVDFNYNRDQIYIRGDYSLLRRAILNLIYNSIEHNHKKVAIEVDLSAVEGKVNLSIADNGRGIEKGEDDNIFNKYYRGGNTKIKGTGLGLAIVKDIIEKHEGNIEYVAGEVGAEFNIELEEYS